MADQDRIEQATSSERPSEVTRRRRAIRWVELAAAAAVMAAGAAWMLLPPSTRTGTSATAPAATASPAPGAGDHLHGGRVLPRGYVGPTLSPPLQLSSPEPTPTGPPAQSRYLAEMKPSAGASNVRSAPGPRAGNTVTMPCAAGKDRDLYREARYLLGGHYRTLTAQILNRGDANASTRVQFLGGDGMMFNKPLPANVPVDVKLDLADSRYLRIRVFCTSSTASVVLTGARVTR